jgi:hypothetical protein
VAKQSDELTGWIRADPHCQTQLAATATPARAPALAEMALDQILAWADAHRAATGDWPTRDSGTVRGARGNLTWYAVDGALNVGYAGVPRGWTLARLLAVHGDDRPDLTLEGILAWADAHHSVAGRWPNFNSGPVEQAPGETWLGIDDALRIGGRGLGARSSLFHVLQEHRSPAADDHRPRLALAQVLTWADAHLTATGRWPTPDSGGVAAASSGETWRQIDQALARGRRGLPPVGSLARLLARRDGPD